MKKTFSIIFVFVMLLTLGLSTVASAQGDDPEPFAVPQAFDSAILNPSTVLQGGTFTIELEFDLDIPGSAYNHFCFYFSDASFITGATWENNPTSNLGDNYGTATKG